MGREEGREGRASGEGHEPEECRQYGKYQWEGRELVPQGLGISRGEGGPGGREESERGTEEDDCKVGS